MANRKVTLDVSDNVIAGAVLANFFPDKTSRLIEAHDSDHAQVVVNKGGYYIPLNIGTGWFLIDTATNVDIVDDLDEGIPEAGKDYYVYACDNSGLLTFKISSASTWPGGFNAENSRKIGGFHTLCVSVGTFSGHALSGYVAGDILPQSIWDLKHRARCGNNAGMVYDHKSNLWVDIYLASGTGASTASVNGGTISDTRNWMDFVDDGGALGKRLLTDREFQLATAGVYAGRNIVYNDDPVTTGGHVNSSSQRMISNIGCEDMAGAMWQWLQDQSFRFDGAANHTHTVTVTGDPQTVTTGNPSGDVAPSWSYSALPGAQGKLYRQGSSGDIKLVAGGLWNAGENCGPRGRDARWTRWDANQYIGARFASEPL